MKLARAAFLVVAVTVAQGGATQPARMDCTPFASRERLTEGTDFRLALPKGLFFHLRAQGAFGWGITVRTRDGKDDFVWVVSPPVQTAPHLQIGPVYGLTARESAHFERSIRFVLTPEDYQRALGLYEQWRTGQLTATEVNARREELQRGTLRLKVTNFSVREGVKIPEGVKGEAFNWIEFEGEACVPR
jgi:hypothetical protein